MNKQDTFKMTISKNISFILFYFCIAIHLQAGYKAIVIDPVIEMNNSFPAPPQNSPISLGDISKNCHRAYQGLYNEIFDILEEHEKFVKLHSEKIKYNNATDEKLNSFWAYKENIIRIDELDDLLKESIPHPVYGHEQTIVLTYPWENFSVGTRFKRYQNYDTSTHYGILWTNFEKKIVKIDRISRKNAIEEIQQDNDKKRKLFIEIINNLVDRVSNNNNNEVIAYVWGGNSFVSPYIDSKSYQENGLWHRIGKNNPYTGYDCSGLIMRMAQIAGLDFPWKTTSVMEKMLKKLTPGDKLENGDLIWIQGHVIIISNIEKNEIIEARGYKSGHGHVQKTTLEQAFENITNYIDLIADYYAEKPIRFKNKKGEFYLEANFKLLKLIS